MKKIVYIQIISFMFLVSLISPSALRKQREKCRKNTNGYLCKIISNSEHTLFQDIALVYKV